MRALLTNANVLHDLHCFMPSVMSADTFVHNGGDFDRAQAQFLISDIDSLIAVNLTLRIFGADAVAAFACRLLGGISLEILFGDEGREAVRFYNLLPNRITSKTVDRLKLQHDLLIGVDFHDLTEWARRNLAPLGAA